MKVTRIIGLLTLAASFALTACGGGGAADHGHPGVGADQQRQCLHGTCAGDGGRAGLRSQSVEQHPRPEPLRPMPQRDHAGADAELRAQRQCEPRLCAGQHGRQSGAALDLDDGHQGERRPQLLARGQQRLRHDLDDLDQQLGECHRGGIRHAGAADGAAGAVGRPELEFPGRPGPTIRRRCTRSPASIARAAIPRTRLPRSNRRIFADPQITTAYQAAIPKIDFTGCLPFNSPTFATTCGIELALLSAAVDGQPQLLERLRDRCGADAGADPGVRQDAEPRPTSIPRWSSARPSR